MLVTMDAIFLVYAPKVIEMNTIEVFLGHACKFQSVSDKG